VSATDHLPTIVVYCATCGCTRERDINAKSANKSAPKYWFLIGIGGFILREKKSKSNYFALFFLLFLLKRTTKNKQASP